jgi:hypothetical protein
MNGMGYSTIEWRLVPFGSTTSFISTLKPLWTTNICLGMKGFEKQIKFMQKANDDNNSP